MIHKYYLKNHYIVIDTNSGAVHEVDELTYKILDFIEPPLKEDCPEPLFDALQEYTKSNILECYNEIYDLFSQDILFSADDYADFTKEMVSSPIKAMCLNISHDCNLRCEYCFAGKGDYNQGRMVMDVKTAKKAVDFLLLHSKGRRFLEVDFFGGEPLMNFEVIKETVEYARQKEKEYDKVFRFTVTTNGLLLDDAKIDYINKEMSNAVLSIDGRKEVTDNIRRTVNGGGCYELIAPKFKKLVESRGEKEYYVRGTFTSYNKDFTNDVLSLADEGFDQISIEPVVAAESEAYALKSDDLPEIFTEYEKLMDTLLFKYKSGEWINFFHFMLDLDQGPCAIKRLRGCGCGNEYIGITPDGDIYPCHQFIGMEQWKMGSVIDGSFNTEIKNSFSKTTIYDKEECCGCWAKFYCSGGCNANNYKYRGDVLKPHKLTCEIEKKRLECAIAMKIEMMQE